MNILAKKFWIALIILAVFAQKGEAAEYTVASYELAETALVVSSSEIQSISQVQGGMAGAPFATDGDYVLKLAWTGQGDRKVECRHDGLSYNLDNFERILVDVLIPAGEALFQANGIIGFWSNNWLPGNWAGGNLVPTQHDEWFTIEMDVSTFSAGLLDHISAMVFEHYGADDGVMYIDNIRLVNNIPDQVIATGHDSRVDLRWEPVSDPCLDGYNIYRSLYVDGNYAKLNSSVHIASVYSDFFGENVRPYSYYIKAVVDGTEQPASSIVTGTPYAMTDDELLTSVQEATFRFFWDWGHPVSGLAREGYNLGHSDDTCAIGGTGMGLMAICVGAERGFVSRSDAAARILKILTFLDENTTRYHGAWSHWVNGATGVTIPFSTYDDGGDLVETSYVAQGLLTIRQYFDSASDAVETDIRDKATALWEGIDWNWYRRLEDTAGTHIYWHWSPNYGWYMGHPVGGYNEAMITYLVALASPTHPIPASCYYSGWTGGWWYKDDGTYYGYRQWVGGFESPMFFLHYTHLGFDPRDKSDNFCNYFDNSRNMSLIDREYCIENPKGFTGYSDLVWGLTASWNPWGYGAHAPGDADNGTISPTAALSSIPYTPDESIATLKHFYHTYGSDGLWGPFGFVDGFNLNENWFASGYVAIDQGPIIVMIENYRTQLCWDLFMANQEITNMMESVGWQVGKRDSVNVPETTTGLKYEYYEGSWYLLPDFDSLEPIEVGSISNFSLAPRNRDDYFAMRFTGYIDILADETYYFYLSSDDGSQLFIGEKLVVDNDGLHGAGDAVWGCIALKAGSHPITVTYFERTDSQQLTVEYETIDMPRQLIPNSYLFSCNLTGDLTDDCNVDIADLHIMASDWLNPYDLDTFSNLSNNWFQGIDM